MAEHLTWGVGNRNPSIADVITDTDGDIINLTSATVRFRAREVGSTTLLVDAAASNTPDATGVVRYDWTADDATTGLLSEPRKALVWWTVTTAGKTQDVLEAVIEVRAHTPETNAYVELEELKSTLEMTGQTFADHDILNALVAASRGIDEATGRRFYADPDALSERYYSPTGYDWVDIDDLIELTSVETDPGGFGTFDYLWTENTHFYLDPLNSDGTVTPWNMLRVHPSSIYRLPVGYPRSIKVTGRFGWTTPPQAVKTACTIIATRLLRRAREAPFGVVAVGLEGEAVRISRFDPDIQFLLAPYTKTQVLVG